MTYRKKLIEVALPLEAINVASAREKSIRHGHPSTLHLWWARRPLAACRAVLFAQLVDDPDDDPMCAGDADLAATKRAELFNLIEELVQWENSNNPRVIGRARSEIARCVATRMIDEKRFGRDDVLSVPRLVPEWRRGQADEAATIAVKVFDIRQMLARPEQVSAFLAEYAPPVLDPFAGGGSIPLEAQRLGLRAHASDLNPVAVLINKALIEIPPKFAGMPPVNPAWQRKSAGEKAARVWHGAEGLADDVRYYGRWMRDEAEKRIGHLYPKVKITKEMAKDRPDLKDYVGQELTVIAWLWARTVASPDPSIGRKHVPLVASFWLSKKKGKEAYVNPIINRDDGTYKFQVVAGRSGTAFDPSQGTIVRTGGRCLVTGTPIPFDHIRAEGKAGRMTQRLMAVVCEGNRGRVYLDPIPEQETLASEVIASDYPVTDLPEKALSFRVQLYGMDQHWKLFTPRQLTALTTFSDLVGEARAKVLADATATDGASTDARPLAEGGTGPQSYADAAATYLGLALSQMTRYSSTLCGWNGTNENVAQVFGRQALPMVWDFAESNTISGKLDIVATCDWESRVLEGLFLGPGGASCQQDARHSIPGSVVVATDPPYYDNIGYADLSDFFYVWLRRSLKEVYPALLSTMLTPKAEEMIASPYRHGGSRSKAAAFFEKGLGSAIGHWREHGCSDYPTTVFYAFKQTETTTQGTASTGWETFLTGLIDHGFGITGTWPLRTEREKGLKGNVNALASSVVLACIPREPNAPMATRREFLNALKRELPDAMKKLQSGNIAPVDLAQAAIGPGMAVFSRYGKVVESDGATMTVRTALTLINQSLDEVLAEQEGEFDGDTRWAVAWFEQHGTQEGPFGVAETLSKAKNTSVAGLVEAGLVAARGGKVKLLGRDAMPDGWDPAADKRPTCWEATQHLIRRLQTQGEQAAADLLTRLGADYGETARDLAYRLYSICERKRWADEALAYNGLVIAWPELTKLALAGRREGPERQGGLFE